MSFEQDITNLTPDQKIAGLLKRAPSGPTFSQSTIEYVEQGIEAATAKFGEALRCKFPGEYAPIATRLEVISRTRRDLPKSSFVVEEGRKLLEYPNGARIPLNRINESIFYANPELGVFKYVATLYPPIGHGDNYIRFPWFNGRLSKVVEVGELSLDDPRVKYLAVGYVTQAAKSIAITRMQELLKRSQLFVGTTTAEGAFTFLDRIHEVVRESRTDQSFIAKGSRTMEAIASKSGLDEQQTQLLLDLAFVRNKAFDQPKEFRQALEPLIRLVAAGDWEEAFSHRDFLLTYFLSSFPNWRGREFRDMGGVTFDSFRDLARAVVKRKVTIHDEDVPGEYKRSFGDIFPKKVERAQREEDRDIIERSVGLSNSILRELADETTVLMRNHSFRKIFGQRSEEAELVITDLTQSLDQRFDVFLGLALLVNPEVNPYVIERFFKSLVSDSDDPADHFVDSPRTFNLRMPNERPFLGVELIDGRQVSWYKTDYLVDVKMRGREQKAMLKNWINFGRVLYEIILLAHQQRGDKDILNLDEVKTALQRAYQKENQKNPMKNQFSLPEYLKAMLSMVPFKPKLTDLDPVVRFIEELETQA